ncbi:MAG: hypothetical protein [Bacteriophage sp.]|nr:MAG: hypothetical protein [Bacteriophage sp.]
MAKKDLILGSGKLYISPVAELDAMPTHEELEIEKNKIGSISGGASLEYEFEIDEIKDDEGFVLYRGLADETLIFKSGILSWDLDNLAMLSAGATVEEGEGKRTLKIGGSNGELNRYIVRFVHTMKTGKKVRVTLIGTANSGFELAFDPENATVIDAELKAVQSFDGKTLVEIEQEVA